MTTGDLKNNLRKLQAELKAIKYEKDVDIKSISKGIALSFLPIYHYAFIEFSQQVAAQIQELNIELFAKTDLRFVEAMYKVLRELFSYKPAITKEQFFSNSFAERKVIMCTDILHRILMRHKSLAPKPKNRQRNREVVNSSMIHSDTTAMHRLTTEASAKLPSPSDLHQISSRPSSCVVAASTNLPSPSDLHQISSRPLSCVVAASAKLPSPSDLHQISSISSSCVVAKVINELHNEQPTACAAERSADNGVKQVGFVGVSYNPTAYDEEVRSVTPDSAVEVIDMNSDGVEARLIDMVPMTPGKPLIAAAQKSDQTALEQISRTIQQLSDTVMSFSNRLAVIEESVAAQHSQMQHVLARLTLVENEQLILKQSGLGDTGGIRHQADMFVQPTLQKMQPFILESSLEPPLHSALQINNSKMTETEHPDPEVSSPSSSSLPSVIGYDSPDAISQIIADTSYQSTIDSKASRQIPQQEAAYKTSTPVEPLTELQQAQRITRMIQNTEELLKTSVVSSTVQP